MSQSLPLWHLGGLNEVGTLESRSFVAVVVSCVV